MPFAFVANAGWRKRGARTGSLGGTIARATWQFSLTPIMFENHPL